jgi:alpha-beta hydrolase superfamily lysophospholipase
MAERFVQRERTSPPEARAVSDAAGKELAAHQRAMPLQRLLDNGMEYADAIALHKLTTQGVPWTEAAIWLAEEDLRRAEAAMAAGHSLTARAWYRHASASFRFAQSPIIHDNDSKRALYRRLIDAFAMACALDDPRSEKITIPYRAGAICGWLMRPPRRTAPPIVIIMGGADGWREAYEPAARSLLERGVGVLLVDGPGQGESRLFHGLYLTADYHLAYSAIVDFLIADGRVGHAIGIYGNSLGGHLAAKVASADHRLIACCVNGGTVRPIEILDRHPRFIERFAAMLGSVDHAEARALIAGLDLSEEVKQMRCPLLVLHGVPDTVFTFANAQRLHEAAGSADKTLLAWDDGDHCLYNHAHEKNCTVADWFLDRLRADNPK